ncbi:hypothetical protein FBZ89_14015 [Nitrospirillum amazonense]|uniref:ATP-grasp domain-containing protein n=1 Tax=Nitrospirillum amazonense TaxID=28077 RepID=A0A560EJW6_9PROT|nr:hypothetical protein [Nitrospirillum amazonense]TWB09670.1 hypothetical protein FBZ89_14015 [Nitrospirillum amazonense]
MTIVCMGGKDYPQITAVRDKLLARGMPVLIIGPQSPDLSLTVQDGLIALRMGDRTVDVGVLWEQIRIDGILKDTSTESYNRTFALREWKALLANIADAFDGVRINNRRSKLNASSKVRQLVLAAQVGFRVPETLLSNSKAHVHSLHHSGGGVIVKTIGARFAVSPGKPMQPILTREVLPQDLEEIGNAGFSQCPAVYQRKVEKRFEARIVCIGDTILPFKIDSQSKPYARIDWRAGNETLDFTPYAISPEVAQGIRRFMTLSGLDVGHFDFIIDRDTEEYVFLECNLDGNWGWLDRSSEGAVSTAYADMLAARWARSDAATVVASRKTQQFLDVC